MNDGRWDRFLGNFNRAIVFVALVGFIGMLLATGAQVLFRYALQISVGWTEELARVLFIVSMFLGIAIAVHEKEHIVVDFLFKKLPAKVQAAGTIVFDVAILALLVSLMRGAARMVDVTWESYMIAISWMRTGYLFLAECFAIALMMIYIVLQIIDCVKTLRSRDEGSAS